MQRKIAFVADGNYGNIKRLARGTCEWAVPQKGLIAREFIYSADSPNLPAGPRRLPAQLLAWEPAAILYSGTDELFSDLDFFLKRGIPVVALNRIPGRDSPQVLSSNLQSFELVHEHYKKRAASIAFFVEGNPILYTKNIEAYKAFAAERRVPYSIYRQRPGAGTLDDIRNISSIAPAMVKWLRAQPKPLGLFSITTFIGLLLRKYCSLAKLRVPDEVMIVGIDDFDVACESDPPISSIRLPFEAMGKRAVEVACQLLDGQQPSSESFVVPGSSIIGRRSTRAEPTHGWNLDAALTFIENHACEGINVEDLRTHTQSISREQFQRNFQANTGSTPRQALEAKRMSEARRLLAETEMSPGWIAGMCGYPDYVHFYKLFKKLHGTNPTEYRKVTQVPG